MKQKMDDLEWQISRIKDRLQYGNCGFEFDQVYSSEAMAHACNRFPKVREWWDKRINSCDRWSYGYLDQKWKMIDARLNCLAAQRAIESLLG